MALEAILCLKDGRRLRLALSHAGGVAASRAMFDRWVEEGDVISVATADGHLLDIRSADVASLQIVDRADPATQRAASNHALRAAPPPPMRLPHRRNTDSVRDARTGPIHPGGAPQGDR